MTEVWSEHLGKWAVLDPDYDIYFTVDGVPQHALELHRLWAADRIDAVQIHWHKSPHDIYRPDLEGGPRAFLRMIYDTRDGGERIVRTSAERRCKPSGGSNFE